MKVYIHVGYPKTATTFLQQEVFPKLDVNYLKGENKEFIKLLFSIRDISKQLDVNAIKLSFNSFFQPNKINLFSLESLSGDIYSKNIDDRYLIADRLKQVFPNAKIILGVREKNSMLKSSWKQYIREGGIYKYDDFVLNVMHENRFDYQPYINYLGHLFGKQNIYLYQFEGIKNNLDATIKAIADFIGVDMPVVQNNTHQTAWDNNQVKMALLLNKFFRTRLNPKGLIPWFNVLPVRFFPPRILVRLSKSIKRFFTDGWWIYLVVILVITVVMTLFDMPGKG